MSRITLYMIPDPAATPLKPARQVLFGVLVATVYAITQVLHLVFGLFFALVIVCAIRGLSLHAWDWSRKAGKVPPSIGPTMNANVVAGA